MKRYAAIFAFLLLVSALAFAQASVGTWKGFVHVNGSLAPNGTIVSGFVAGANKANFTVGNDLGLAGKGQGYYLIHLTGNSGDNVTFKVNGLNLIATNGTDNTTQTWSFGWHPGPDPSETFNLSINKSANSAACGLDTACTSGLCVHSVCRSSSPFCGDGFCDSGESCSSDDSACSSGFACTSGCVATTTTTTGGGGGGGGGGASLPSTTETINSIVANTPATVVVTEAKLPVSAVELTTTATLTNVQVTVKEVSKPSAAGIAIASDTGSVYKYLDITTSVANSQLSKAQIKFKVPKTWIVSNNIDANTIALNRLVGTTWTKLPTTKVSETATHVLYEAETPGFSTFAITGEKVTAAPAPACGNGIIESGEDCDSSNLGGSTCLSVGYAGGTLACGADCRFDKSGCTTLLPEKPAEKPEEKPLIPGLPEAGTPAAALAVLVLIIIIGAAYWFFGRKKTQP